MAITRAAVQTEVVSELGPLLSLAGKSIVTSTPNPDLNGPMAFALQALSVTPTDPTAVSDADLANLDNTQYTQICQLTEYYAIKKCLNSIVMPNEKAQDRDQEWDEMTRRFTAQMNSLAAQYQSYLNIRVNPIQAMPYATRFPTPRHIERWALGRGRIDH